MIAPAGTMPNGGWKFRASPDVTLTAPLKSMLLDAIVRWRVENSVPVGSPEAELDAQLCAENPRFCHAEDRDYSVPPDQNLLIERMAGWADRLKSAMPAGGFRLASDSVTAARVSRCQGCPRDKPANPSCPACADALESVYSRMRNHRPRPANGGARACEVMSWDNFTAASLSREYVEPVEDQKKFLPVHCWLLQED